MRFKFDLDGRGVSFAADRGIYTKEAILIAAQIFAGRAEVFLDEPSNAFGVTLKARKKTAGKAELRELAGEFLNELLNQEYRFIVGRFNRKISNLIIAQALLSARGDDGRPETAPEEQAPEFKAAVSKLMEEARAEISRTMPKKLAPQGLPLPPAAESADV